MSQLPVGAAARAEADSRLARVAHGLYHQIACIQGYSELLLQGGVGAEMSRDMLEQMHVSALRLERALTEVMELEQLDKHGANHLSVSPQALEPVIEAALLTWVAPRDRDRVDIELPSSVPHVAIDSHGLQLALGHVLANALAYSTPPARVELTLVKAGRGATAALGLRITDRGIGMTREQVAHAFEPFYRADPSAANRGAGLGLTLVRALMTAMGARVELVSKPGKGTALTLWLPCSGGGKSSRRR